MTHVACRTDRCSQFERIYPLDAAFDTMAEAPAEVRENKRYKDIGDFSISGLAKTINDDFGDKGLDILVHSLANGPEVKKALIDTSRAGYMAAVAVSAYSMVSLMQQPGSVDAKGRKRDVADLSRR